MHGVCTTPSATCPARCRTRRTYALTNATLPYLLELAEHGAAEAARRDPALALGFNTVAGHVTNAAVAEALGVPSVDPLVSLA